MMTPERIADLGTVVRSRHAIEIADYEWAAYLGECLCEIERLRTGLADIKRDKGHVSINNGTATLGDFIRQLLGETK